MMNPTRTIIISLILFLAFPGISFAETQTFTSSGTFVVPSGVTSILVSMVGGGGGGGASRSPAKFTGSGGGGAGAIVSYTLSGLTPGASMPVVVGAAGAGGPSGGGFGSAGGNSSFGILSCTGGMGGSNLTGGGGAGGTCYGASEGINNGVAGWGANTCNPGGASYYGSGGGCGAFGSAGSGYGAGGGGRNFYGGWSGSGGFVSLTYTVIPLGTINVTSNVSSSWVITGPATITGSGTSQSSASPPGTYTITWGDVAGYTAPATQSLTLVSGGTITFNGAYVAATCSVSSVSWSASGTSCGDSSYGPAEIADGSSVVVASTNGNTGSVTLTCAAGEVSQSNPTCAVPSATLSGSNCTIASGGSFCAAPFTWSISNATSPNLFNSTTGIQYTTAASGTNVSFAITKGNNTVQARDGTTVLRSTPVTGTCTSGTVWDGSVCAPTSLPTVSISASPKRVEVGGSSTISWSSNHVTSCTITKNGAFFSSAHTSAGTLDTGITAQTEYKINCEGNDGSTGNIATVLVNVNPGFTEF